MSQIQYADEVIGIYTLHRRPVPKRGMLQLSPGQGADGYGKKITTDICLKFNGEKKESRVYCICFSNSATCYIDIKSQPLYLKSGVHYEVLDD